MDLLKTQLDRIQKQLASLSASQKMLTAALVAIMVMTLVWWGRYAGEAEMEPVLNQSMSQEELASAVQELGARGIRYTTTGDRLLVPADRKIEAYAALSYSHAMPRDTKTGFEDMVSKMTPWDPVDKSQIMFNRGKEVMLAQIIRKFPHVTDAEVMIAFNSERHIEGSIQPSATITLTVPPDSTGGQKLVDAAADAVQGAVSGLSRSKIKVVVNGAPARVHDADNEAVAVQGDDQLDLIQKNEVRLSNKIKEHFVYISGLMVAVTVKLNNTSSVEQRTEYDPKGVLQKETRSQNETDESTSPGASAGGEPGIASNAGLSIPNAGGASAASGPSTTHEKNTTEFQNFVSKTDRSSKTPAGDVTVIGATVRVPVSYFASVFERQNGTTKEPTQRELVPLIESELPKIRVDVLRCTGLQAEKDVSVETYSDPMPTVATAVAQVSPFSMTTVGGHTKEIALAALAVMSLFMVSMMVRKGTVTPAIAQVAMPLEMPTSLDAGEALAGEAGAGGAMLDGMELDDDAVRSQQMLDQVSTLVKENPEAAATLVKRWLNRT